MIPIEEIVVIPDLYDPKEELILARGGFTDFFSNYGFGWLDPSVLLRSVHRPDAELVPNPLGERVRQLIANIMTFVLPDDLYARIRTAKKEDLQDFGLIHRIIAEAHLFATVKLAASGEERLHGKLAAGVGGHVDDADLVYSEAKLKYGTIDRLIRHAANREILEELKAEDEITFAYIAGFGVVPFGVINSSASEVESVHIGMINVMAVPASIGLSINEADKLKPVKLLLSELKDVEKLQETYTLDNWTKIIFAGGATPLAERIVASVRATLS